MDVKPGYKQTEVGVIPEDWEIHTIGDSMRLINGRAFKPEDWKEHGLPIVRIQNLNDTESAFNYCSGSVEDRHRIEAGDLLFAWSGTTGTSFGARIWGGPTGVLNQHIFKVTPDQKKLTLGYALLVLRKVQENIEKHAHGFKASFVHVKKSDLVGVQLPLPPTKAEQEAIAEALSDADALIESLEQLIAKKRHLKQGAMQELLTGEKRLPGFSGEWGVRELRDVCVKIQDGTHFSPQLGGRDFLYVTSKNIGFGTLDVSSAETISAAEHAKIYARCDVAKGDLLLTKDGANTGHAALNTIDGPFSLLSSVAMLRFDSRRHAAAYFLYQILSSDGQRQIKQLMSGNAITRLTLLKIRSLHFPVAPLPEQTAIAVVLSDMDAEIAALEAKLAKARQLKQGIMQELLTGRIRLV